MRALLPSPADDVDLHAFYAAGWLDGGLRVNFISSADGAAQAGGKSAGLQTPGDNRVFAALRDLADVVLAGAGTAVIEGYRPITVSAKRAAIRREHGLRDVLPTAVISRTLRLDPAAELFAGSAAAPTIVLTSAAAPADRRATLAASLDVVICGDDRVEPARARQALEERGLTRILSEGGPTAFADLAAGGVVDELCLSVAPFLVGPGPTRITDGASWTDRAGLTLTGVLEEDSALFLRYAVDRTGETLTR
jgi:riboflavin biosynthesis pyrimidine reductase